MPALQRSTKPKHTIQALFPEARVSMAQVFAAQIGNLADIMSGEELAKPPGSNPAVGRRRSARLSSTGRSIAWHCQMSLCLGPAPGATKGRRADRIGLAHLLRSHDAAAGPRQDQEALSCISFELGPEVLSQRAWAIDMVCSARCQTEVAPQTMTNVLTPFRASVRP